MKNAEMFIVVGAHGAMAESRHSGPGVYYGVRRGGVATGYPTRAAANRAIRETIRWRVAEGLAWEWMKMRVVRVVPPKGASR